MKYLLVPILLVGLAAGQSDAIAAPAPALKIMCGIPNSHEVVTCRLSGHRFHAGESIRVTYSVTFTSLPPSHGKLPEKIYRRMATTDSQGSFVRPPLTFAVVRYHESFRMTVTARGASGDRAGITYVAVAQ